MNEIIATLTNIVAAAAVLEDLREDRLFGEGLDGAVELTGTLVRLRAMAPWASAALECIEGGEIAAAAHSLRSNADETLRMGGEEAVNALEKIAALIDEEA